jgi:MarR family transcriptional regulator, organic hydroperoxide resistance regulator
MPLKVMTGMRSKNTMPESAEIIALPDAQHSLGYRIRYTYRAFVKSLAEELASLQITTMQWSTLRVLWQEEGISQVDLAQRMMVERASLTQVLASMEAKKLITRSRDRSDGRKVRIYLTSPGRELRRKALPVADRINSRATQGLSRRETQELDALLTKVLINLKSGTRGRRQPGTSVSAIAKSEGE